MNSSYDEASLEQVVGQLAGTQDAKTTQPQNAQIQDN